MTHVAATGIARIRHAGTGEVFEIEAAELYFEAIGADERNMGPEVHHQADFEHPELGTLVWNLWEYPIGIENMQETEIDEHELLQNIEFGIEHDPDYDEPPDEDDTPDLAALLTRLPAQLEAMDAALARLAEPAGLIGHNRPPNEFRLKLDEDDIARLRESIVAVQGELGKTDAASTADPGPLTTARDHISALGLKLGGWTKFAGVAVATGVLGGVGKGIGEQIWNETSALHMLVHAIVQTLSIWLHALTALL